MHACSFHIHYVKLIKRWRKVCGGLLGNFEQYGAYQCWCQTTPARASYYEEAIEIGSLLEETHKELH